MALRSTVDFDWGVYVFVFEQDDDMVTTAGCDDKGSKSEQGLVGGGHRASWVTMLLMLVCCEIRSLLPTSCNLEWLWKRQPL